MRLLLLEAVVVVVTGQTESVGKQQEKTVVTVAVRGEVVLLEQGIHHQQPQAKEITVGQGLTVRLLLTQVVAVVAQKILHQLVLVTTHLLALLGQAERVLLHRRLLHPPFLHLGMVIFLVVVVGVLDLGLLGLVVLAAVGLVVHTLQHLLDLMDLLTQEVVAVVIQEILGQEVTAAPALLS